ncbi:hypothetical protein BC829DRAFT_430094 [Chytridium lagenaria]|nr:hypothetical protein BC829DRAFT_430094 [Chytridium lagenaria]
MTELTTWVGPFGIPIPDIRYDEIHRLLTVEKRIPVIRHSPDIPEGIQQLIERCLEIQQASRPSFSDVLAILEALTESTESDRTGSGNSVRSNASFRVSETMLEERESSTLSAMGGWTGSPRVAVNDTFDFRVAETAVLERDGSASSLSTYGGAALSRSASSSGTSRGSGVQGLENRMGNLHLNSPPATPNRLSTSSSSSSSSYSQNQLFSPVSSTSSSASSSNTLFPPPSLSRSTSNPGLRRAPSPSPIINPPPPPTSSTPQAASIPSTPSTSQPSKKTHPPRIPQQSHGTWSSPSSHCRLLPKHFGDDLKTFTAILFDPLWIALESNWGTTIVSTISLIGIMGGIYVAQDLTTPGLVLLLERLERCQKVFGENDPDTLHAGVAVVLYLTANGESAGAETLIRKIATRAAKTYGEGEAATIHAQMILGVVLVENGRWAEAEGVLFKVLAKRRNDDGGDELNFVVTLQSLAKALWKQLKFDAAESMLLEAVMKAKGMDEEWAEELMKEVETVRKLKKYQGHVESLEQQAKLCVQMGKYEMAEAVMGLCVEVNVKVYGDKHEKTLESRKVLEEMKKKGQQKKVGTTSVNVLINTAKAAPAAKKKKRNFFGL